MKFTVDSWAPEYGSPIPLQELAPADAPADVNVEVPAADWEPLAPEASAVEPDCIEFIDGVRRIDARVWITEDGGETRLGLCASYAAGLVRCDGKARVVDVQVRRGLFARAGVPAFATSVGAYPLRAVAEDDLESLINGLQQRMGELEVELALSAGSADLAPGERPLIVVDGPLSGRQNVPGAVGYVKTHRVGYLPQVLEEVVGGLRPGQRTPLFVTQTTWSRYSWYLRLPGGEGHPWAGVVRCEASADLALEAVRKLADQTAMALPRFASEAHKDPRAPQNLYPIAALEREMRRRLGDQGFVYRALRIAAGRAR